MAIAKQMNTGGTPTQKWKITGLVLLMGVALIVIFPGAVNRGLKAVNSKTNIGLPLFPESGFNLGLDLQGGVHLIYQADTSKVPEAERASAVEGVHDVIERRVRGGLGVAEPLVQTTKVGNDYRLIVELPGVTDVRTAIQMIGETPVLEFKEENHDAPRALTKEEEKSLVAFNATAKKTAYEALRAVQNGMNFAAAATKYSADETSKSKEGSLGFIKAEDYPELYAWAKTVANGKVGNTLVESASGLNVVKRLGERVSPTNASTTEYEVARIFIPTKKASDIIPPADLWKNTDLSGKQLHRAEVVQNSQNGEVQVSLNFDSQGSQMFADLTKRNVGKQIAILLDGNILSAPRVSEPILSGSAVITGGFTVTEAKLLAQRLNSGALPLPIELVSQQTIGATLGAESLNKSFYAGLAGIVLLAIFMVLYYRLPGLLSIVSLVVYAVLSLALFKLAGVTLTLSGIAGFILSVGMAVDTNVLVFERLKEELQQGRALRTASEESFARAWLSIRDSHVTTLISCVVLMWFGTGFVQGFAVTLAIGVLMSLFTSVIVTRTVMRVVFTWFHNESNWTILGHRGGQTNV